MFVVRPFSDPISLSEHFFSASFSAHSSDRLGHSLIRCTDTLLRETLYALLSKYFSACSFKGNIRPCRWLLDEAADLELRDNRGNTALHRAAKAGQEAVVKLLIKRGAKGGRNWEGKGYTPVELAAGHPDLADWIMRYAQPQAFQTLSPNRKEQSDAHLAAQIPTVSSKSMI